MKVFFLSKSFYGIPQVYLVVADSEEEAKVLLTGDRLQDEDDDLYVNVTPDQRFSWEKTLTELDLTKTHVVLVEPPGDINYGGHH